MIKKIIMRTEKLPRTKCEYQARLVLRKLTKEDGSVEYATHEEIFPDDRDDNTPYTISGKYYNDLKTAVDGFFKRQSEHSEYRYLAIFAE